MATRTGSSRLAGSCFLLRTIRRRTLSSKPQHNSCRHPHIVLGRTEKARLNVISLKPQGNKRNQVVVDTAAQRRNKRRIGTSAVCSDVSASKHSFGEGPDLSYRHRHSRAEQEIVLVDVDAHAGTGLSLTKDWDTLRPVVATKICDYANPWQCLAFQ